MGHFHDLEVYVVICQIVVEARSVADQADTVYNVKTTQSRNMFVNNI